MHRAESDANAHIWVISALGGDDEGFLSSNTLQLGVPARDFSKALWLLSEDIEGITILA